MTSSAFIADAAIAFCSSMIASNRSGLGLAIPPTIHTPLRGGLTSGQAGRQEQPLVEPQFGHLWHAPLRTISVPHS